MEVEVQQSRLAKALNNMSKIAASTKAGLPILSNVLLRANENQLILTATNLEIAIVEYISVRPKKRQVVKKRFAAIVLVKKERRSERCFFQVSRSYTSFFPLC